MTDFLWGLENSGWLKHIKAVLDAGVFIARVSHYVNLLRQVTLQLELQPSVKPPLVLLSLYTSIREIDLLTFYWFIESTFIGGPFYCNMNSVIILWYAL